MKATSIFLGCFWLASIAALVVSFSPAFAANVQIKCGSTYYVPLKQVAFDGTVSDVTSVTTLAVASADPTKATAVLGTMPGTKDPAVVVKPVAGGMGVTATVTDSSNAMTPGSAAFDVIVPPPALMLDTSHMQMTTP